MKMEKTVRKDRTARKHGAFPLFIIFYLVSLIFYLSCEQASGPRVEGGQEQETGGGEDWWTGEGGEGWMPEEETEEPAVVVGISVRKPDTTLYARN
jgi:hypothetical protein